MVERIRGDRGIDAVLEWGCRRARRGGLGFHLRIRRLFLIKQKYRQGHVSVEPGKLTGAD
jgi:hypothetical protein